MNDRYEIIQQLGSGGFGTVYLAKDKELDRNIAIKRLNITEQDDGKVLRDQLLAEAKTLAAMRHPNIVSIFDIQSTPSGGEIVMEHVQGVTLDGLVSKHLLLIRDFKFVAGQILSAIASSHAHGVLHCDLKPANVMLCQLPGSQYEIKVLDFGMAPEALKEPKERSGTGKLIGSIFFMAPEQFETGAVSVQTDIYALGCLFYYLLTGCYPFYGETSVQVMAAHMTGKFQPIRSIRPDLPEALCKWVESHFVLKPEHRFSSCQVSLDLLEELDLVDTAEVFALSSKKTSDSIGSRLVRPITIDSLKQSEPTAPLTSYDSLLTATRGGKAAKTTSVVARAPERSKLKTFDEEEATTRPIDATWYFSVEESRKGPVSLEKLKRLCAEGKFQRNDLVWHSSFVDWVTAEKCADLADSILQSKKTAAKRKADENKKMATMQKTQLLNQGKADEKPKRNGELVSGETILSILGLLLTGIVIALKPLQIPATSLGLTWLLLFFGFVITKVRQVKSGIAWVLIGLFLPFLGDFIFSLRTGIRAIAGVALMATSTVAMAFLCIEMANKEPVPHAYGLEWPMTSILKVFGAI